MHSKSKLALGAAIVAMPALALASPVLSTGTITSTTYNSKVDAVNNPNNDAYYNASSIVPGAGDVAVGSTVLGTNYVGNNEASGGTVNVLVDNRTASNPSNAGNASLNPNEGTSGSNATFDLGAGPQPWFAAFTLPTSANGTGYDITSVQVISGHQDGRTNQAYDILVSSDGTHFYSLNDNSEHDLPANTAAGTASTGFSFSPNGGGAAQSTITPSTGNLLASGINYFEFVDLSSGNDIYREVAFYGTPTAAPEPASLSLLALGATALLARRRRRS